MDSKSDITFIILTKNEELHIARAIENVAPVARRIIVVDSGSTDRTVEIAESLGAEVHFLEWPGNQAQQMNNALGKIKIDTDWIFRLDADEYLTDELKQELAERLPALAENVSAVEIPLGRCFMGRRLKHGIVNGIRLIRLFRTGKVRYENRVMDEHPLILEGETVAFKGKFVDDNRMPLSYFLSKHDNYALREAAILLEQKYSLGEDADGGSLLSQSSSRKRRSKSRYARLPRYWRASWYFLYRYIFRLGFLDGKEGFLWDFFQGWWYRTLVDAKLLEIERATGGDAVRIREYLAARGIRF